MPKKIVILCPHNAAKSVYSAARLQQRASEIGLDLSVTTGGTDPDNVVLPIVRVRLGSLGHNVTTVPRVIPADELAEADMIINIGCEPSQLPTTKPIVDWSIPNFSDDHEAAFDSLEQHVEELVGQL